jgi:hypothetical protein
MVFCSRAFAQHASDPNAVDLTPYLIRIDTNGLRITQLPINIGDVNGGASDDILLEQQLHDTSSYPPYLHHVALMSAGGATALSEVGVPGIATIAGNFDGNSLLDIATTSFVNSVLQTRIYWAAPAPDYFDSTHSVLLIDPSASNVAPVLAQDYNHDGTCDLFLISNSRAYLFIGDNHWRDVSYIFPSDSIALGGTPYSYHTGQALGKFDRSGFPSLCMASSGWVDGTSRTALFRVQFYPNKSSMGGMLWSTTPVDLFLDTITNSEAFVYSSAILAYDITGDGIDDLLVCDSAHIYVFKGGSGFGTHTLHKSDADFVITSPALLDPVHYAGSSFATNIFAAGDLTGTGIPYLGVTGSLEAGPSLVPVTWLYAGGTALDTYFDGSIKFTNAGGTRITHTAGVKTRDELVVNRTMGTSTECDLVSQGTDMLPHTVSSVKLANESSGIAVKYLTNNRVEIEGVGASPESSIEAMNFLGQQVNLKAERSVSGGSYTLDMSALPTGGYFAVIRDHAERWIVKLMR